jgi:hypothetical protein
MIRVSGGLHHQMRIMTTHTSVLGDSDKFASDVAQLCYTHYNQVLSKNGKPQKQCEWTLLAAVVKTSVIHEGTAGKLELHFC